MCNALWEPLHDLTWLLVRELGLRLESRGTALLKRELRETGAQPDGCSYPQHSAQIIGNRQIDLSTDPPPHIVAEVDLSSQSLGDIELIPTTWASAT
ncbi:MAG: hypothetical protein ACREEM_04030 [Blastocatellia bacterium]